MATLLDPMLSEFREEVVITGTNVVQMRIRLPPEEMYGWEI